MPAKTMIAALGAGALCLVSMSAANAAGLGGTVSGHVEAFGGKAFGEAVSERSKATDAGRGNGEEDAIGGHGSSDPGVGNTGGPGRNNGGG